jgi:MHS family shikimate/dehydroshikimate transporter-like MFS transporter
VNQETSTAPTPPPSMRRVAIASLVGTMVEWYDYFIFGTASALVFGKVFFPALSGTAGTLASFAILSVSFFVRPLGAVIFGHFGDRIGRKRLLIISVLLMGGTTFMVGLVPTTETIGVAAPILLVLLRILQGLGVSGEWGGAVLLVVEHAPPKQRGFYGSFPQIGLALGLLLAAGSFALLGLLPADAFIAWGWRIPFLASIVLLGIALYIRLQIAETPVFEEAQRRAQDETHNRVPIVELLRDHWRGVVAAICIRLAGDVQGYTVTVFLVAYVVNELNGSGTIANIAIATAAAFSVIVLPVFGILSDRVGRKPIYLCGTILAIVFAFPFFWLLDINATWSIILAAVVMYGLAVMIPYSVQGTLFSELFPTQVRYSGISLAYHSEGIIGGGIAPFIAGSLIAWSGGAPWPVALYMIAVGLITLTATVLTREGYRRNLYDSAAPSQPIAQSTDTTASRA